MVRSMFRAEWNEAMAGRMPDITINAYLEAIYGPRDSVKPIVMITYNPKKTSEDYTRDQRKFDIGHTRRVLRMTVPCRFKE